MNTKTFTKSFNQHPSNMKFIARLRFKAESMGLKPKVKAHFTIVTITIKEATEEQVATLKQEVGA